MQLTGFAAENLLICDGFSFASENAANVERDAESLPVAWKLLSAGSNALCKNGLPGELALSSEDLKSIVVHHRLKGEMVPIDSNHYLFELAGRKNLDECEVLKLNPSGVAAMGFGHLALRGENTELWIERVVWNPTARILLAEKIFRYFSPAIRGLVEPPLRVTSVALENQPCINNLDSLAASAEARPQPTKGFVMNPKLAAAIASLLHRDTLALEAENCEGDTLAEEVQAKADLLGAIRSMLELSENVSDKALSAALQKALERAELADALRQELDQLKMSAEDDKRRKLIASGLASGKLANSQLSWARTLDAVSLAAYLEHAPVTVPVGYAKRALPQIDADAMDLTPEDERTIARLGLNRNDYINEKKGLRK